MPQLLFGHDQQVADWVVAHIPHVNGSFKSCAALGVVSDGELIGGVVYHEYRINDIQISLAATDKRWLTKALMRSFFLYPFEQLKCERVTSFIPSRNATTRRFCEKIGFTQEGNIRRGFVGDDCIVYGMLRDECKWIKENNGQE